MSFEKFLFIPVGGPAQFVDGHPTPAVVSDLLGGAIAAPIAVPNGHVSVWVRETGATEGAARNIIGSIIAMMIGQSEAFPILGPCVITRVSWRVDPATRRAFGAAGGFSGDPESLARFEHLLADVSLALAGRSDGFSHPAVDDRWAQGIRDAAEECARMPIPAEWPYDGGEGGQDEVAALMRSLGLGQAFTQVSMQVSAS